MDPADGWLAAGRLSAIVGEINDQVGDAANFVFLPGDNANHATAAQYHAITAALASLRLPYRVIPGDHDFEGGDLDEYESAFSKANRPEVEVIAGHRCIFIDVVSAGAGGPDFRVTMHHQNRVLGELMRAEAEGQPAVVFMHAYPGDLAVDGETFACAFADARVAFVDTGHTHYNELLNDGRVVYGAARSTAQIEEDSGCPGFAMVTVYNHVPSWRFKRLGGDWPFVQIVGPADFRMVTRPVDVRQVPRPGPVEIVAKVFGGGDDCEVVVTVAGATYMMTPTDGVDLWSAMVTLPAGLNTVTVAAGGDRDTIRVIVREVDDLPRRNLAIAPGHDIHTLGAWPEHGIDGSRLGPNKNGARQ